MNTITISDDPVNGTHSAQFRWCTENGLTSKPGPVLTGPDVQPIFRKLKNPLVVKTIECGKFGGICSSRRCREEHSKTISMTSA